MPDRFPKPTSEKEEKLVVCDCGSEVESTKECPFCSDDMCEDCSSACDRCGEHHHIDCLIKDKDGDRYCQPCLDTMWELDRAAEKVKHSGKVTDLIALHNLIFGEKK